tara:strand:- start:11411 stop:12475 length:1065 start_codon:yes stop_codon:yes gene_type:complete
LNIKDVGQLIISGIEGKSLSDSEKEFLESNNIGGIILFEKNYDSPAQLAELINQIQTCRDDYPLFITIDQEGGRVKRLKHTFFQSPAMFDIAKQDSPKLTFEVHKLMAEQLKACGINLDYSPCCDIWSNPKNNVIGDRSFGTSPEVVEKHVSAAIRGLQTGKIISCAKHFPGHGDTLKDSHYDLPYVKKSLEELEQFELIPFQKAAKSRCETMMMAHLVVDAIDPELPTSLSKKAYDYLRSSLKFNRVVFTDDMEMHAITDNYGVAESSVMAIEAGADIVIYRSMEAARTAYDAIKKAINDRKLELSYIDEKLKRIFELKKSYLDEYTPVYIPEIDKSMNHQKANELSEKLSQE